MKESVLKFANPRIKYMMIEANDKFRKEAYKGMPMEAETGIVNNFENKEAKVSLDIKLGDESIESPFQIKVIIEADFKWEEEILEEKITDMLKVNGSAMLLSYVRPVVSFMTVQAGFPPFHIPFMDTTD